MNTFSYIFVIAVLAGLLLQLWLAARQAAHISGHAKQVPEAFADSVPLEDHQKAASYSLARLGVERWDLALSVLVLFAWTLGGGLNALRPPAPWVWVCASSGVVSR